MKCFLLIPLLFTFTVLCTVCNADNVDEQDEILDSQWEKFKTTYKKHFNTTEHEEKRRLIFANNLAYIKKHNLKALLGELTYLLEINKFADMSPEETIGPIYDATNEYEKNNEYIVPQNNESLPEVVDWRRKDLVTLVKDQGHCGSDWVFAYIGAVEGQLAKKYGKMISLAAQQIVDCSSEVPGCYNGRIAMAHRYASLFGIEKDQTYRYLRHNDTCKYSVGKVIIEPYGFAILKPHTEATLQYAVATWGPIAVTIKTCPTDFRLYKGGVYDQVHCDSAKHTYNLLVVGYTEDHWIVKSSFGKNWGNNGYIKMVRNKKNQSCISCAAFQVDVLFIGHA